MSARATSLPYAGIGLVPNVGQVFEEFTLEIPSPTIQLQLGNSRLMKHIHQFAIDIELQLAMRGVADPDRQSSLVTRQPIGFPFRQPTLPQDPVHDLHIGRRPRNRPQ